MNNELKLEMASNGLEHRIYEQALPYYTSGEEFSRYNSKTDELLSSQFLVYKNTADEAALMEGCKLLACQLPSDTKPEGVVVVGVERRYFNLLQESIVLTITKPSDYYAVDSGWPSIYNEEYNRRLGVVYILDEKYQYLLKCQLDFKKVVSSALEFHIGYDLIKTSDELLGILEKELNGLKEIGVSDTLTNHRLKSTEFLLEFVGQRLKSTFDIYKEISEAYPNLYPKFEYILC